MMKMIEILINVVKKNLGKFLINFLSNNNLKISNCMWSSQCVGPTTWNFLFYQKCCYDVPMIMMHTY